MEFNGPSAGGDARGRGCKAAQLRAGPPQPGLGPLLPRLQEDQQAPASGEESAWLPFFQV